MLRYTNGGDYWLTTTNSVHCLWIAQPAPPPPHPPQEIKLALPQLAPPPPASENVWLWHCTLNILNICEFSTIPDTLVCFASRMMLKISLSEETLAILWFAPMMFCHSYTDCWILPWIDQPIVLVDLAIIIIFCSGCVCSIFQHLLRMMPFKNGLWPEVTKGGTQPHLLIDWLQNNIGCSKGVRAVKIIVS